VTSGQFPVVAVVVTYNRRDLLEGCLTSIENQTHRPDLVLVVDNASNDDTAEHLVARDWVIAHRVIRLPRNYGGALGFAVGLHSASQFDADAVWLMDDDAAAQPDALEYLLEDMKVAAQEGVQPAFACSMVIWKDGSAARMNIPRANAQWNLTAARIGRQVVDVDSASFVSVLIPVAHARAVGLPHLGYFKWYDDTEYTLRLRGRFGPGICSLRSVVRHLPVHNEGALPWRTKAADVDDQVRGSLSLRDVRGVLSVSRDTAVALSSRSVGARHKARLLAGYLSGVAYRPPVLALDPDRPPASRRS
jgi:GT2 family glycosyltransferase